MKEWDVKLTDVTEEVTKIQRKNRSCDKKIVELNVERCELELKKDYETEERNKELKKKIINFCAERSRLIRKLLKNHEKISESREKLKKSECR